jgi:hypothetical protein
LIILDNFLDKVMYNEILNEQTFFPPIMEKGDQIAVEINSYHTEAASCYAPFMFWDGWWNSPANTLKKKVVQKIWEFNLPCSVEEIIGFEYWTRTYAAGQYLQPHVDEDTFRYEEDKIFTGPLIGSVLYGLDNENGGYLELYKSLLQDGSYMALEKHKADPLLSPIEERERVAYKGNRLIIFDTGHLLHGTTPAKSGLRQVMVTNVWHKKMPPTALVKNKFFYE